MVFSWDVGETGGGVEPYMTPLLAEVQRDGWQDGSCRYQQRPSGRDFLLPGIIVQYKDGRLDPLTLNQCLVFQYRVSRKLIQHLNNRKPTCLIIRAMQLACSLNFQKVAALRNLGRPRTPVPRAAQPLASDAWPAPCFQIINGASCQGSSHGEEDPDDVVQVQH